MSRDFKLSLFIFRRDLRLADNTALNAALARSEQVAVCFISDPLQLTNNPYFSRPSASFMLASLDSLGDAVQKRGGKLYFFQGETENILRRLLSANKIAAVFFNRDYTPFSRRRDEAIAQVCAVGGAQCFAFDDALLYPPGTILTAEGKPYTVFTPFLRKALAVAVLKPALEENGHLFAGQLRCSGFSGIAPELLALPSAKNAGRDAGLRILSKTGAFKRYGATRDLPSLDTTGLSPHNKFGTVSIREVWYALVRRLGPDNRILQELCWRDFFTHVAWSFPHVFEGPFKKQFASLRWDNDETLFAAWRAGETGFPLVDAGMRQLAQTGIMHGRARMVTASFLVKDLHIDWRWGEKYFASALADYDPAVNNGNWQWCASTGCDAQPWFRIFNPSLQLERYDPDGGYIRRWLPELAKSSTEEIRGLSKGRSISGYPAMIADHGRESAKAKVSYARTAGKV